MTIRSTVLSVFLLLFSFSIAQAFQSDTFVEGKVVNQQGEPIASATVAIFEPNSVEPLSGVVTDETGFFSLPVDPGDYEIRISYVSYEDYEQEISIGEGEILDLDDVELTSSTADLDEVVVESRAPQMEMNFDRRTYRTDDDLDAFGGTALDLFDNIPSVETDFDGNLSLRGSENVRVLINGRTSALVSDGADALAAIPAESIDRIEVITNPSARYDAEGDAGVINIILKRNRIAGFNGSVIGRTGIPGDNRVSSNVNFLSNNINWFANVGFRYRDRPAEENRFQQFQSPDTAYSYRQNQDRLRTELRGNVRVGAEIFIGETQTLTPSAYFRVRGRDNITETFYSDMTFDGSPVQEVFREDDEQQSRMDMEFELAYDKEFEDENRSLQIDAKVDYNPRQQDNFIFEENRTDNFLVGQQRIDNDRNRTDLQFSADYVHPLGEFVEIEAGARSSFRWVDQDYMAEDYVDGNWQVLPEFTAQFDYYENINALYGIASTNIGNFSVQGGLRAEQTVIQTALEGGEETDRNFTNLFPSLFVGYEFNDENSIQASYSRRLSRPRFRNVRPFSNYRDSRNIFTGNPALNPVYSNSYELSYLRFWESGSVSTSVYHQYRTGVTERVTEADDEGVTRRFPINLSTQERWGAEIAASQTFGESLRIRTSLNHYFSDTEGTLQNEEIQRSSQSTFGRIRAQWEVVDGLNLQSSFFYSGPRDNTQGRRSSSYSMNSGISKNLLNDRATLSLSVRDLFNTRGRTTIIDEPGFYSESERRWRTRSVRLNFVYRFGQADS